MVMKLKLADNSKSSVSVSEVTFGREFNESLVHQVVTAYAAGGRQGTKQQKTRSDVSGGGIKPWRQKGTGRARAGTIRSPLWRKGGVIFAARPRDYTQKVNRKMYQGAMRSIFSELIRQERLVVVESFSVEQPRTKALNQKLKDLGIKDGLIVTEEVDENLYLSSRNLRNVDACDVQAIDPVSLIGYRNIIVTVPALKKIEEMLA